MPDTLFPVYFNLTFGCLEGQVLHNIVQINNHLFFSSPFTFCKIKTPKHDQHLNNKQQVFNEDWFAVPYVMVTCQVQLNDSRSTFLPTFAGNIIKPSIHSCNMVKTDLIRKTELSTKLTGMPTIAFGVSWSRRKKVQRAWALQFKVKK